MMMKRKKNKTVDGGAVLKPLPKIVTLREFVAGLERDGFRVAERFPALMAAIKEDTHDERAN
jgi:hypothetical protein